MTHHDICYTNNHDNQKLKQCAVSGHDHDEGLIPFKCKNWWFVFVLTEKLLWPRRPRSVRPSVCSSFRHRIFLWTGSSLCSLLLRNYSTDFSNDISINWWNNVDVQRTLHFDLDPSMTAGKSHEILQFCKFRCLTDSSLCLLLLQNYSTDFSNGPPMTIPINWGNNLVRSTLIVKDIDLLFLLHFCNDISVATHAMTFFYAVCIIVNEILCKPIILYHNSQMREPQFNSVDIYNPPSSSFILHRLGWQLGD